MFFYHWFNGTEVVAAPYRTGEEALAQATHDLRTGQYPPVQIIDEKNDVLYDIDQIAVCADENCLITVELTKQEAQQLSIDATSENTTALIDEAVDGVEPIIQSSIDYAKEKLAEDIAKNPVAEEAIP